MLVAASHNKLERLWSAITQTRKNFGHEFVFEKNYADAMDMDAFIVDDDEECSRNAFRFKTKYTNMDYDVL